MSVDFRELPPDTRPVWYRYEDVRFAPPLDEWERPCGEGRTDVQLREFPVVRETPKGAWLETWSGPRFVLRDARKRYACPTLEEARASFVARKRRQLKLIRAQERHVEAALQILAQESREVAA